MLKVVLNWVNGKIKRSINAVSVMTIAGNGVKKILLLFKTDFIVQVAKTKANEDLT